MSPSSLQARDPQSIRGRFERALAGEPIQWPVYAAYDWFVEHRAINWPSLFAQGLGRINHANLFETLRPNLQIAESLQPTGDGVRRDVRWITDRGELHEYYLGEWRREYLVKTPDDYRILQRALEGTQYTATDVPFCRSEAALGDGGITVGQMGRTPLMEVQIDLAGLQRFSMDLADEHPALMELLELMTELVLRQCREAVKTSARCVKLWENLSIETIGRRQYRRRLVPLYGKILEILTQAGKQLLVHYDGKLRLIAEEIAGLGIDGIDSLTPPPEGDMSVAEARAPLAREIPLAAPAAGLAPRKSRRPERPNRPHDRRRGAPAVLPDDQQGRAAELGTNRARRVAGDSRPGP